VRCCDMDRGGRLWRVESSKWVSEVRYEEVGIVKNML
jgi:glycine cleavage system H lipoate-binding protein